MLLENIVFRRILAILVMGTVLCTEDAFSETPAGTNQVRIKTGTPRKDGINPYWLALGWKADNGIQREANGIAYINGPDRSGVDDPVSVATKIVVAAHKALARIKPSERGAVIEQAKGGDGRLLPEVIYRNKAGFTLTKVVEQDYSNQTDRTLLSDPPFGSANIGLAIDVFGIYGRQANGVVKVAIDSGEPIRIKTHELSPGKIEDQIAEQLSAIDIDASIGGSPLVTDTLAKNTQGIGMSFDGDEIHLMGLEARAVTVNVDDPAIGIITRLAFDGGGEGKALSILLYAFAAIFIGIIGFLMFKRPRFEEWK